MTDIPHPSELEARLRRHRTIDFILIGGLVALDVFMVGHLVASGHLALLPVALFLLAASATFYLLPLWPLVQLVWRRESSTRLPERVGRYQAEEVRAMIADVLRPYRGRETPTIYITEPKEANAAAINSLFFDFIPPLNAVYVSRHLFQILRRGEIQAVLAHELAHFHRYLQPLGRVQFVLMVFNALLPLEILLDLDLPPRTVSLAFVTWMAATGILLRLLNWWCLRPSRAQEFLCDLHGARRYGLLNSVNGLLGIGRSAEISRMLLAALLQRIDADGTLALGQLPALMEKIDALLPHEPLSPQDVKTAMERALASPEFRPHHQPQTPAEQKAERRQITVLTEKLLLDRTFAVIDWRRFDCVNPDGRVDAREYPRLIDILEQEPESQLFQRAEDHPALAARGTHPTIRERILFLERCRREGVELPLE